MWIFGQRNSHKWDINIDGIYKYPTESIGKEHGDRVVTLCLGEDEIAQYAYIYITGLIDNGDDRGLYICVDKEEDMDYIYNQFIDSISNHPLYVDLRKVENLRIAEP